MLHSFMNVLPTLRPCTGGYGPLQADVIDVLMALGYSRTEAREGLNQVPEDVTKSEDKIRHALRALAKH